MPQDAGEAVRILEKELMSTDKFRLCFMCSCRLFFFACKLDHRLLGHSDIKTTMIYICTIWIYFLDKQSDTSHYGLQINLEAVL